jgi:hypothetical protein
MLECESSLNTKSTTRPPAATQWAGLLKHEEHEEGTKSTKENSRSGFGAKGTESRSQVFCLSSCLFVLFVFKKPLGNRRRLKRIA